MVYLCNCHGSTTNDDWRSLGAKVAIGPSANNYIPEPVTTFFLQNWLDSRTASQAAQTAFDTSVPFYSLVFPPAATTQFTPVTQSVWCGEEWVENGCEGESPITHAKYRYSCFKAKYCDTTVEVPSGVNLAPHENVASSALVVTGDGGLRFNWTY